MKTKYSLFFIVLLGTILRFYALGNAPYGFHRDEAFLGYNAYSILKTGKDMTGDFLPLHLKSFLYSPAGYAYFTIPFLMLFDLSAFSVRFTSAIFGSLTILIFFLLARRLFSEQKNKDQIALISSFLLAISPWHINLSRTATENTLAVFLIILGILTYLIWLKSNLKLSIFFSFLSFFISLFIYQAPRSFLPLLIPVLIFLWWKNKRKENKFLQVFLYFILILLPLVFIMSSKELSLRLRTVNVFSTAETQLTIDEAIREDGVMSQSAWLSRIYHNKIIGYANQFTRSYMDHFSFNFLFLQYGLPMRYRIYGIGLLYLFEFPLLLYGAYLAIKSFNRTNKLLFAWILLAPIGSALTYDDIPNLQRTLQMLPPLLIIEALAITSILEKLKFIPKIFTFCTLSTILLWSVSQYLHQYYIHGLRHQPWYRHEGYKELVPYVNSISQNYDSVIITNKESAPAIFFLFYGKYDPEKFRAETKSEITQDFDRVNFSKYIFSQEDCPLREFESLSGWENTGKSNTLYVNYGACKPLKFFGTKLKAIIRPDDSEVFQIIGT